MRKFVITVVVCLIMAQPAYAVENSDNSAENMENVILRLLSDPMSDAIEDYYGEPRLFWPDNNKLLSIRHMPGSSTYEVVVQAETFYGPHNPPYGIETMTFIVSYGEIRLLNFKHQSRTS